MIRALTAILGPDARGLHQTAVQAAVAAILQGLVVLTAIPVLDRLLGPEPADAWPWIGALVVLALMQLTAAAFAQARAFGVGVQIARTLHHRIGAHVTALPVGWFTASNRARLTRTAGESVLALMGAPAHLLRPLLTAVLAPTTMVVGLAWVDARLALTLALCIPVLLIVLRVGTRSVAMADAARARVSAEAGDRVVEFARAQHVLRAFGRTGLDAERLTTALAAQHRADRRLVRRIVPGLVAFGTTLRVVLVVALVLVVNRATGADGDAGLLVGELVVVWSAATAILTGAELVTALRTMRNALEDVEWVLAATPMPEPPESDAERPGGHDVAFDRVSFGYAGGPELPVLEEASFTLPQGSVTALMGPSGSGKTTVARLLTRAFDVDGGAVRVGGVDVRRIGAAGRADTVSWVPQDTRLFAGSLADNVRIARPGADEGQVRDALLAAGLRPDGDGPDALRPGSEVGDGGSRLSGGQRQRVAIARALLRDTPVLVLDEPDSALDPEARVAVAETIARLGDTRTLLVITHERRPPAWADQVLVLQDGAVAVQPGPAARTGGRAVGTTAPRA